MTNSYRTPTRFEISTLDAEGNLLADLYFGADEYRAASIVDRTVAVSASDPGSTVATVQTLRVYDGEPADVVLVHV